MEKKRKGFMVVLGEGDEEGESVRCVSKVGELSLYRERNQPISQLICIFRNSFELFNLSTTTTCFRISERPGV